MQIRAVNFALPLSLPRSAGTTDQVAGARLPAGQEAELQRRAMGTNLVRRLTLDGPGTLRSLNLAPGGQLCATMADQERTELQVIEPDGTVRFRKSIPREDDKHFFQEATVSRDGQRVYAAERADQTLVVWDKATGEELWRASHEHPKASFYPIHENPDGSLYFCGSGFGAVWSSEGQFLWEHHQGDEATRANAFHAGIAYQGGTNGLVAVRDGETLWRLPRPGDAVYEKVTPAASGVVAALSTTRWKARAALQFTGTLQSIDPAGKIRWTHEFPGFLTRPLVRPDGSVVVVDSSGIVHALSDHGKVLWTRDLAITSADLFSERRQREGYPTDVAMDDQGNLYTGWGNELHCLSADGQPRGHLQIDLQLARLAEPLLTADGTLYLHDGKRQIVAIDTKGLLEFNSTSRCLPAGSPIQVGPNGVRIGGVTLPVRSTR